MMIDEEKIEEAAFESLKKDVDVLRHNIGNAYIEGFHAGVNWFLGNLVHDASEEPRTTPKGEYGFVKDEDIVWLLAVTKNNEPKVMFSTHEEEYEGDTEGYWIFHDEEGNGYNPFYDEIKKWAYIDDIMRGGTTKRKEGVSMKK